MLTRLDLGEVTRTTEFEVGEWLVAYRSGLAGGIYLRLIGVWCRLLTSPQHHHHFHIAACERLVTVILMTFYFKIYIII